MINQAHVPLTLRSDARIKSEGCGEVRTSVRGGEIPRAPPRSAPRCHRSRYRLAPLLRPPVPHGPQGEVLFTIR